MKDNRDMIWIGIRTLVGEVVVEMRIIAPADAFRGEMTAAVESAKSRIAERIDEHYAGTTPPTPWFGAAALRAQERSS